MNHIHPAIREDFEAVNGLVLARLHSDVALVQNIGHYIVEGGGKRLRPLLCLLSARALGYAGERHVELAAVIEFLHTATLLHDDVVDVSALRRGRPTANTQWGNAPSVLVGDFIYSRAFQLLVAMGDLRLLQLIADTTNLIAEGEVEQLARAGDPATTEAQYLDVIRKKTAVLFAAACEGAAILAGADEAGQSAMRGFGLDLGLAFQIIDDVLDYEGDPAVMGKNVGDDLAEGKPTLPLIRAMAAGTPAQARTVQEAIRQKDASRLADVVAVVRDTGALAHARRAAEQHQERALNAIAGLAESPFLQNLRDIAALAVRRAA
jgi:octaprenyl-diphosphate synthase